jgi:hypothetical protein
MLAIAISRATRGVNCPRGVLHQPATPWTATVKPATRDASMRSLS